MSKHLQKLLLIAALLVPWAVQAQTPGDLVSTFPYSCDFESQSVSGTWVTVNGTQENGWYIGAAVNATTGGTQSLYVSNNQGVSNTYDVNTSAASYSWAYQRFTFGAGGYNISFNWRNYGEIDSDPYDFFRVFIVPDNVTLTAGALPSTAYTWSNQFMSDVPSGWIGINDSATTYFVGDSVFSTVNAEFTIITPGNYKLVFLWLNDDNACYNPAAAVDDIVITESSCPVPADIIVNANVSDSVAITWVAFSSVSSFDIAIIAAGTTFDENTAEINNVSGDNVVIDTLNPGIYDVYIRSNCGSETSSWVGPVSFNSLPEYNMAATGNATLYTCNRTIYDCGGPDGQYTANNDSYLTIYPPDADHILKLWGYSYTESSFDYLRITDLLTNEVLFLDNATPNGQTIDTIIAFGGVQLYFHSDGSIYYDGFEVHVTCIDAPTCMPVQNLTVDAATTDSIYLSWEDNSNSGATYLVEYRTGNGAWNSIEVFDTIAEIGDLELNSLYEFKVTALCGDEDSSLTAGPVTARTLAGAPISNFPYFCGFEIYEDDDENVVNEGADWVLENGTEANYWMLGNATNNGGTRSMYITDNGTSNSYTVSTISYVFSYATFMFEAGEYAYSYDWKANGESSYDFIRAAVVPNTVEFTAGDYNGFNNTSAVPAGGVAIDGAYRLNLQSDWQNQSGTFVIPTDGLYKVVFMWRNDGSGGTQPPAAIDNIQIVRNTCPQPVALHATGVTPDSIYVAWNPGGEESHWIVSIGSEEGVDVTDSSYVFSDLQPNTVYTIRVRGICSDEDTSMMTSILVRTACGTISELPIFENFEDVSTGSSSTGSAFVPCWHRLNNGTSYGGYPYVSSSTTYNHTPSGSKGLYWYNSTTTGSYGDYQVIILPEIDTLALPVATTQLSFWARSSSTSYSPVLYVGVMTDPDSINSFQYFDTINVGNSTQWQKYTTYFANFTGSGQYIAIRANRSSSWYVYVDDIMLDSIQSCFEPVDVTVLSAVQPDSVVISWHSNPLSSTTGFEIVVGPSGFDPDTAENTIELTDSIYTFTDLAGGVTYDFYVRSNCGSDGYSHWTEPLVFSPGQYVIGTSGTGVVSMCGGVIYDDGGPNGQYSNNVDYQLTVYPSSPDSMLTFYGTAYTEGSIDYLRIYEGAGTGGNILWQTGTSSSQDVIPLITCMSGPITLHFHTDGSIVYDGFDVHINCVAAPECAAVENLNVSAGPVSAIATWDEGFFGTYTGATVEYKEDTASDWTTLPMVTSKYVTITGLTPNTTYDLRVATDCEGFTGAYATTTFSTPDFGCLVVDATSSFMDTIINGSATNSYIPSYSFYNYSLTQQIFTSTEIGHGGQITSIYLMPSAYSVARNLEFYMGHVSQTTATSYLNPGDLTLVYSGTISTMTANQFNEIQLTTPFNYNGSDNLLLYVRDMTGSYTSGNTWKGAESTSGVSRYVYQDSGPYNIGHNGGTASSFRCNIILAGASCAQQTTCAAPVSAVVDVTTTTVDIAWAAGNTETSWNVYYRLASSDTWSAPINVTTEYYQFTNLNSGTNYEFKVEGVCDTQHLATVLTATTLCAEISTLPYFEDFNSWGAGSGVLPQCWYRTGSYSTYTYISSSYSHSGSGGAVYMYQGSTDSYRSRLIMPAVDTTIFAINQLQLVYSVYTTTSYQHPTLIIGVMEDPTDLSTFVPVDTIHSNGMSGGWETYEVPLNSYVGEGQYICLSTMYDGSTKYFYVDDITIEMIPSCQRPDNLTATNATTSSVDLSWNERGNASQWIIEYGPFGFTPGTGTQVLTNSNPYTLNGLNPSFQAEYYVRSLCSSTDTSDYSRLSCRISIDQTPATLPYIYTFEDATEWSNWQVVSNVNTINWTRGNGTSAAEGSYSMYVSNDGGASWATNFDRVVNASAYRDIDFGTTPNNFEVTFRAKAGGCFGQSIYDGIYVIMVEPTDTMVISNSAYTTAWGYMPHVNVYQDTNWDIYTLYFDSVSGIKRLVFNWFNTNSQDLGTIVQGGGAIDSLAVVLPSCPRPSGLQATPGSNSALLSWEGDATTNYQVAFRQYPNGTNTFVNCVGNQTTINGLDAMTQYAFWVRKICGAGDTSNFSLGILFTTTMCDNAVEGYNFDSTMTAYSSGSSYSPIGYSLYNYSYTQIIIDSAQMAQLNNGDGSPVDITAFGYMPIDDNGDGYFNNMFVYMANVSESSLSSFILPDATHVFDTVISDGSFTTSDVNQWNLIGLDHNFTWDGHSNVLFAVNRLNGSYGSTNYFAAHNISGNKMRYVYNDNNAYDIATVTGGSTSSYVGDIKFVSCGTSASCRVPNVMPATNVTYQSATINWSSNATDFEVAVKAATEATWPAEVAVSNVTSYNVTGLQPETQYQFRVRAICDAAEGLISNWAEGTFTTAELPCFVPTDFHTTNIGYTNATFAWNADASQNQWTIHVWNSSFDTIYTANTNPFTVTGLEDVVEYSAAVNAVCGGGLVESEYSDTITFSTEACAPVTDVVMSNIGAYTATVTWSGTASSYEVEYGDENFSQGTGTIITTTSTTVSITGLDAEETYDVYVRAVCEPGVISIWSPKVTFNTVAGGGNTYHIEVVANPADGGTVTGTGDYLEGSTVTISATPNQGYEFVNWSDNVTTASRQITVTADATYTANFRQTQGIISQQPTANSQLSIYPNPTTDATTIAVSGVEGEVTIVIVDMNGRTVKSESMSCNGDCTKRMEVSGLAQGAYFVRVNGEGINMVRKLIVK